MKLTTLAALLFTLFVAGCGQSGPLYVPGDPSSIEPAAQPAQTDTDEDDDSEESSNP